MGIVIGNGILQPFSILINDYSIYNSKYVIDDAVAQRRKPDTVALQADACNATRRIIHIGIFVTLNVIKLSSPKYFVQLTLLALKVSFVKTILLRKKKICETPKSFLKTYLDSIIWKAPKFYIFFHSCV